MAFEPDHLEICRVLRKLRVSHQAICRTTRKDTVELSTASTKSSRATTTTKLSTASTKSSKAPTSTAESTPSASNKATTPSASLDDSPKDCSGIT
ncbi:hypothetical protein I3843_06G153000 [Carya illinoinensis]|nr:hypothetical protein I3843_06G153000 [Carya illinoinensis]